MWASRPERARALRRRLIKLQRGSIGLLYLNFDKRNAPEIKQLLRPRRVPTPRSAHRSLASVDRAIKRQPAHDAQSRRLQKPSFIL